MKTFFKSLLIAGLFSMVAAARAAGPDIEQLFRDSRFRELLAQQAAEQAASAERQKEQQTERDFIANMNRFVATWNQFAGEYNTKKIFNVKLACKASHAFRALESTTAWQQPSRQRQQGCAHP